VIAKIRELLSDLPWEELPLTLLRMLGMPPARMELRAGNLSDAMSLRPRVPNPWEQPDILGLGAGGGDIILSSWLEEALRDEVFRSRVRNAFIRTRSEHILQQVEAHVRQHGIPTAEERHQRVLREQLQGEELQLRRVLASVEEALWRLRLDRTADDIRRNALDLLEWADENSHGGASRASRDVVAELRRTIAGHAQQIREHLVASEQSSAADAPAESQERGVD